jgi:hypothetical protein
LGKNDFIIVNNLQWETNRPSVWIVFYLQPPIAWDEAPDGEDNSVAEAISEDMN